MEETINTIGSNDSGRYDNDFEKLPRDEEEVNAPTEHLAATDSPGGDATNIESATVGDEPAPSPSKSQLNVEDISTTMPQTATSDEEGDKGGICAGCESYHVITTHIMCPCPLTILLFYTTYPHLPFAVPSVFPSHVS